MSVSTAKAVRELALEIPEATRIFDKIGIDYCCGGGKSLEEACATANLTADARCVTPPAAHETEIGRCRFRLPPR